jgi:hypothetical protein
MKLDFPLFEKSINLHSHEFLLHPRTLTAMDHNVTAIATPPDFGRGSSSQLICQTCHRQFARMWLLRRHITEAHGQIRPHICRFCQRSFQRQCDLRLHERTHPPQDHHPMMSYLHDTAYQRVKTRFQNELSTHFPDTPCAHCGTLLLPRNVSWIPIEDGRIYPIEEILQHQPRFRTIAAQREVAVCGKCRIIPQQPIDGGPWPMILLELPQHSRMFLSPLTINTNLGRTQGAQAYLNPYTTYRTVTGKPVFTSLTCPTRILNLTCL